MKGLAKKIKISQKMLFLAKKKKEKNYPKYSINLKNSDIFKETNSFQLSNNAFDLLTLFQICEIIFSSYSEGISKSLQLEISMDESISIIHSDY